MQHSDKSDFGGSNTPVEIRDLWQTPMWLWNPLNDKYRFRLDVAASHQNHLCDRYFTIDDDALTKSWDPVDGSIYRPEYASVWCNPPYSETGKWVEKAALEAVDITSAIVMIVPADTSTKWFKFALETCSEIVFLVGGRVNFVRADTQEEVKGNPNGSVLLTWNTAKTINCNLTYLDINELKGIKK